MWDMGYVIGTILFFAVMLAYVRGCARLGSDSSEQES